MWANVNSDERRLKKGRERIDRSRKVDLLPKGTCDCVQRSADCHVMEIFFSPSHSEANLFFPHPLLCVCGCAGALVVSTLC